MSENAVVWISLAIVVVAILAWKGYITIPIPRLWPSQGGIRTNVLMPQTVAVAPTATPDLSSRELGLMMAVAARREAELELASTVAEDARARLLKGFQAPFVDTFGVIQGHPEVAEETKPSAGA
jgi:hypothetical protein